MEHAKRAFDTDSTLPRLPIPPLKQTMDRYVESLKPHLTETELQETQNKIDRFLAPRFEVTDNNGQKIMYSEADLLQRRLIEFEKTQQFSWLELWWEEMAYLSWRAPLFINSNYWLTFTPYPKPYGQIGYRDVGIEPMESGREVLTNVGFSEFQVRIAAGIINRAVDFKDMVENGLLPAHLVGPKPICMNQFKRIFGVTRLPRPERDEMFKYTGYTKYAIVMARNQLYKVPLYTNKGQRLLDGDLEDLLTKVIENVQRLKDNELEPPIGILTGGHRDRWAAAYAELAQHTNPEALSTFQEIQHSAFFLSLEDFCLPKEGDDYSFQRLLKSGAIPGHNRWYDKHMTMVIDRNGNFGATGEHSPADAVVPATLYNYVVTKVHDAKNLIQKDKPTPSAFRAIARTGLNKDHPEYNDDSVEDPVRLKFGKVSTNVMGMIKETEIELKNIEAESLSISLQYPKYGSNFIKKLKVSPDAYFQMALQLTYYKLHGKLAPTYESASTRMYQHGRTETIRSLTTEMATFINAMTNPRASDIEKYNAFTAASKKHSQMLRIASSGNGVDRHMLGLRLAYSRLRPLGYEPYCDFASALAVFSDPAFTKSSTWKLSTSGLFPNELFSHTGFGCSEMQEGYGMNYTINPNSLRIGIEGKRGPRAGKSDVMKFRQILKEVFDELQNTFSRFAIEKPVSTISSKL
ncbi:Carnitine O-acetyltransferase [Zancudomyces culisetae]|uniref:Carnitine O-acetyltransferase n=1 Tax=Zancudomyces culisetae TaxID=1213189 RepID=A0A1R1PY28_ZANCU|nr:Carnitine O-acetyltransferase [Zancudomyces culisetae]|eukprot:OMH85874.1 Carnitine O-acetyltransferase [Zancudomyces culisetae]